MASNRKISDLDHVPMPPKKSDFFLLAREDVANYKVTFGNAYTVFRSGVVFQTGNQNISGVKTFFDPIYGNLSGIARHVVHGVYVTGNQTVSGVKTFDEYILGNVSGNLSGTARYVVDGVYTKGDQSLFGIKDFKDDIYLSGQSIHSRITGEIQKALKPIHDQLENVVYITGDQKISGIKSFDSFISGNVSGNLSGTARYVQDGVYTTGDQTIKGIKSFSDFISGNVSGNLSGTARYVQDGVYTTGDQTIKGIKSFSDFISGNVSGNLSGTARYVQDGVYTTGDQTIKGIKSFSDFISGNVSGNLSGTALYVRSGVYQTGDQQITGRKDFWGDLLVSGKPFTEYSTKLDETQVLIITGFDQTVTGNKTFYDYIIPSGGITTTGDNNNLYIADRESFPSYQNAAKKDALTIAFKSGVYITGGDLHVGGTLHADRIFAVDTVVGDSGTMVLTDGRDPTLYEAPGNSLSLAYESGVYITGGAELITEGDIYVGGTLHADALEAVDTLVGDSGSMVLTDGRDPTLYEGPDNSLSMAFESGVYITGGAELITEGDVYVGGTLHADALEAVDTLVGDSGSMVLTDGRDPTLYEGPDNSLSMAFESGVYITGGAELITEGDVYVGGTLHADALEAVDTLVGDSGSMVLTDGRDPTLYEGPENSLSMAFESGVYITGGAELITEGDVYVGGTLHADALEAVDTLVGDSGSMVLTDGRDPTLYEGPENSLSMAFESGVYITGGAELITEGDVYVGGTLHADALEAVDTLVGDSGSMVLTDGRDPTLYEGPDNSLSMAFESGVYITGGAELITEGDVYVGGTLHADALEAVDTLVGDSGSMVLTDGRDPTLYEGPENSLSMAFESGVYITGGAELITEGDIYVGGTLHADALEAVDTLVGDSGSMVLTDGRDPTLYEGPDNSLSMAFESGVYITGGAELITEGDVYVGGTLHADALEAVDTLVGDSGSMVLTDGRDPTLYEGPDNSLSMAFESGVYITGGAELITEGDVYVGGTLHADALEAVDTLVGDSGSMVLTDGRDPTLYEGPENSLSMAFESGVYITGGAELITEGDVYVGGTLHADALEAVDTLVGDSGSMVLTDGRDPTLYEGPENSLSMAFESGVYITGGAELITEGDVYVGGTLHADALEAVDTLVGDSGSMVLTDGRDPTLYEGPENSLSMAFESGVYITGGAELITEGDIYVGGTLHADALEAVDTLVGDSGSMVLTDGRDPTLYEGPENSLSMAFESGVYITGGAELITEGDIYVGGTLHADALEAVDTLVGDSGSMVLTDGRDPTLYEGPDNSLSMAFESGVYITGGAELITEGDVYVGGTLHADALEAVDTLVGDSGSMVLTDGRDPTLYEGPENSLSMAFESGVYITGGAELITEGDVYVGGTLHADALEAVDTLVGDSGSMVLTDGRDPTLYEGPENSLSMAFESGVYITGGAELITEGDVYVGGTLHADALEAVDTLVGDSGSMVLTDGRDPTLYEGPEDSLSMAFESGVYITGGADLFLGNDLFISGRSLGETITQFASKAPVKINSEFFYTTGDYGGWNSNTDNLCAQGYEYDPVRHICSPDGKWFTVNDDDFSKEIKSRSSDDLGILIGRDTGIGSDPRDVDGGYIINISRLFNGSIGIWGNKKYDYVRDNQFATSAISACKIECSKADNEYTISVLDNIGNSESSLSITIIESEWNLENRIRALLGIAQQNYVRRKLGLIKEPDHGTYLLHADKGADLFIQNDLYVDKIIGYPNPLSIQNVVDIIAYPKGMFVGETGLYQVHNNSLTIGFESGVNITGDLKVSNNIEADNIISNKITDGRSAEIYEGPENSLSLAFESGVYITGGADLITEGDVYVGGTLHADALEAVDTLVGDSGSMVLTDGRDPTLYESDENSLSLAFESGVYITGGADLITEGDVYVGGTLHADALEAVDTLVGDSGSMVLTDGRDPTLYESDENSLSLAFESGVYITGGADLITEGDVYVGGTLHADALEAVDTLVGDSGSMVLTDGRDPTLYESDENSLSLAFESGVYITGGADLITEGDVYVGGTLHADALEAVDTLVGDSGSMVLTDGRDPTLYESDENSLSLAFESGVYITGGADLITEGDIYVGGTLHADSLEAVDTLVGDSGSMVLTDGRDPTLYEGPESSLSLAFESGVYITGGADLITEGDIYVGGSLNVNEIIAYPDSIINISGAISVSEEIYLSGYKLSSLFASHDSVGNDSINNGDLSSFNPTYLTGVSGIESYSGIVVTDGRSAEIYEGPENSLSLAFESGVYITGGADLITEGDIYVGGTLHADALEAVDTLVGDSGSMVLTDGRDPTLYESDENSLSLAFESGVYITGGADLITEGDIYVGGTLHADALEAVDTLVGDSGSMVLTDGRDPTLYEGPESSLSLAFESGVYITGGADLITEGDIYVGGTLHADALEAVDTLVGDSGSMVLTDGRDPTLYESDENSLSLAFESGVYITGGASLAVENNLTVRGTLFADYISPFDSLIGDSGSMVLTDGRDPTLYEGPESSLSLAFESGVYITGGGNLYVQGSIIAANVGDVDISSININNPVYDVYDLNYTHSDGQIALITNASLNGTQTMAYFYNNNWYRTLDDKLLLAYSPYANNQKRVNVDLDLTSKLILDLSLGKTNISGVKDASDDSFIIGTNSQDLNLQPFYNPTGLNGKPTMEFNGYSNIISETGGFMPGMSTNEIEALTIISVYNIPDDYNNYSGVLIGFKDNDGTYKDKETFSVIANNNIFHDGATNQGSVTANSGNFIRITARNQTSQIDFVNGQLNIEDYFPNSPVLPYIEGELTIGNAHRADPRSTINSAAYDKSYFSGKISEIIVVEGMLTGEEAKKVEGYLAHKWFGTGDQNPLIQNHPYKVLPVIQ